MKWTSALSTCAFSGVGMDVWTDERMFDMRAYAGACKLCTAVPTSLALVAVASTGWLV